MAGRSVGRFCRIGAFPQVLHRWVLALSFFPPYREVSALHCAPHILDGWVFAVGFTRQSCLLDGRRDILSDMLIERGGC